MGHSNVWNSHPKKYGPGSRLWYNHLPHSTFALKHSNFLYEIVVFGLCLYNVTLAMWMRLVMC